MAMMLATSFAGLSGRCTSRGVGRWLQLAALVTASAGTALLASCSTDSRGAATTTSGSMGIITEPAPV
ncbi:MAG: hypothetical protein ACOVP8_10115, partial [Phycisphaerales bacterium]